MAEKFRPIERRVRVEELLQLLQLSRRTFYRRIAEKKYPPLNKDGRISFYSESVVQELVNQ
jgi:predicted DNA-binding transcriptional regulator AlpA